jgi:hypothetical protein
MPLINVEQSSRVTFIAEVNLSAVTGIPLSFRKISPLSYGVFLDFTSGLTQHMNSFLFHAVSNATVFFWFI